MEAVELTFPPAGNWYCPQIISVNAVNKIAYGSKNNIVLLDKGFENDEILETPPKVSLLLGAHSEKSKIVSLAWSPITEDEVVSASDDGFVKLWNTKDKICITQHQKHKQLAKNDKFKVNCLSWSGADPDFIFSSDENGNIISWNPKQVNSYQEYLFGKDSIIVLQAHPKTQELLAYGCKFGLVFIVSTIGVGRLLHKFRGHNEDIQGLSWSPKSESLLASSGRDKKLTIWSLETGKALLSKSISVSKSPSPNFWMTCIWISENNLLTSGLNGECLLWTYSSGFLKTESLHHHHSRSLYSFSGHQPEMIVSLGQNRSLLSYNVSIKKIHFQLPTFASSIYSIISHPIEPSLLAIGSGDSQIRLWKERGGAQFFEFRSIRHKLLTGKILCLSWHPEIENLLAFGTSEGRIGTLNTNNESVSLLPYQHRSSVYTLLWTPKSMREDTSDYFLLSLGDGLTVIHDAFSSSKGKDSSIELPNSSSSSLKTTELSLYPKGFLYALGFEDGSIALKKTMTHETFLTCKNSHKLIQCLSWHPYIMPSGSSTYSSLLASSSNDSDIHIWNLKGYLEEDFKVSSKLLTSPQMILRGHVGRVIQVSWSPIDEEKLLSVSYDTSAQIWNAISGTPLANFSGHESRLYCGIWSSYDSDRVYTGGEDSLLHGWSISKVSQVLPSKKERKKIGKIGKTKEETDEKAVNLSLNNTIKNSANLSTTSKSFTSGNSSKDKNSSSSSKSKIHFPISSFAENQGCNSASEDCILLDDLLSGKVRELTLSPNNLHLSYFVEDGEVSLGTYEVEHLLEMGHNESGALVQYWTTGEVSHVVSKASTEGRLTDWLVSLALRSGVDLGQRACYSYGEQLERLEANYAKASSYFLMASKAERAVESLAKGGLYRAAIALAKSSYPPRDERLLSLYKDWALSSTADGNFELAAKCWISAGSQENAGNILCKRGDLPSLTAASILLRRSGLKERANVLCLQICSSLVSSRDFESLNFYLSLSDYPMMREYYALFSSLSPILKEFTGDKEVPWLVVARDKLKDFMNDWKDTYVKFKSHCSGSGEERLREELVMGALTQFEPQTCLRHIVTAVYLSYDYPLSFPGLLTGLLPVNSLDPPSVGRQLLGQPLDWQCNWIELNSLSLYAYAFKLRNWRKEDGCWTEEEMNDFETVFLQEDILRSQVLREEIIAAEKEVEAFIPEVQQPLTSELHELHSSKPKIQSLRLKDESSTPNDETLTSEEQPYKSDDETLSSEYQSLKSESQVLRSKEVESSTPNDETLSSEDQSFKSESQVLRPKEVESSTPNDETLSSEDQSYKSESLVLRLKEVESLTPNQETLTSEEQPYKSDDKTLSSEDQSLKSEPLVLRSKEVESSTPNDETLSSEEQPQVLRPKEDESLKHEIQTRHYENKEENEFIKEKDVRTLVSNLQTLSLSENGNWEPVNETKSPSFPDSLMSSFPFRPSFADTFLKGQSSSTEAKKEIQRLKWIESRTNVLLSPFPNLTECLRDYCQKLLSHHHHQDQQNQNDSFREKEKLRSRRVATWAYWKVAESDMSAFIKFMK